MLAWASKLVLTTIHPCNNQLFETQTTFINIPYNHNSNLAL